MTRSIVTTLAAAAIALQASAALTLDQARTEARANYPEIAMSGILEQTRDLTLHNISTQWYPQAIVGGQATWQNKVAHFSDQTRNLFKTMGIDVPGLRKDQYRVGALVHQNIWDGGASGAERDIARATTEARLRKTDVDMYALDGRIDDLFFGILLAQEQIKEINLTLTLLQSNLHTVQTYYKDGVATRSDVDAVMAQDLTVRQMLTQAKSAESTLRAVLGIFMGRDVAAEELVRPETPALTDTTCNRPELRAFDAMDKALDSKRSAVRAALMPRVGLFAGAFYGSPGLDLIDDMMRHRWSFNFMVGLNVAWNVGALYTRKNDLRKIELGKSEVDVERRLFLLQNSIEQAQENGAIKRLNALIADDARIVELRKAVRNAAESKLRNGVIDTNDLLQKITDESMARQEMMSRQIELLKAQYQLMHSRN